MATTIVDYGTLKAAVVDWAKRTDLGSQLGNFIDRAHVKIVEAVGPLDSLIDNTDTNPYILYYPYTYLYGALAEVGKYTRDMEMVNLYTSLFNEEINNAVTTGFDRLRPTPLQKPF